MRRDKRAYYERTGNLEQMRMLNEQLERILVEKQDTDQFLRAIALHYKGVYIVNMKTGRMRCIFTPENFKKMEENANGCSLSRSSNMNGNWSRKTGAASLISCSTLRTSISTSWKMASFA